jgi:hypothetical protein
MATNARMAPVSERLADAMAIERGNDEALTKVAQAVDPAEGLAEVEQIRDVVRDHLSALVTLSPSVGIAEDGGVSSEPRGPLREAISAAEQGFAAATHAYADLHATARILYEPDLCELAEKHLADAISGLQVLAALKTKALADELNAAGIFCQCRCPSCSIGACGCVRSSTASVADVWGWPDPPIAEGVELRSPPRPGSQLAAADIHVRDRVLSIDGVLVHSIPEMQGALRKHPFGETAQLSVQRFTGEIVDVPVKRADPP